MYSHIDMEELKNYNPKLYDFLSFDPTKIQDFKKVFIDGGEEKTHFGDGGRDAISEAAEAAANATAAASTTPKVYAIPLFWKWITPVVTVTSFYILKLQAATAIPWLPFIIL